MINFAISKIQTELFDSGFFSIVGGVSRFVFSEQHEQDVPISSLNVYDNECLIPDDKNILFPNSDFKGGGFFVVADGINNSDKKKMEFEFPVQFNFWFNLPKLGFQDETGNSLLIPQILKSLNSIDGNIEFGNENLMMEIIVGNISVASDQFKMNFNYPFVTNRINLRIKIFQNWRCIQNLTLADEIDCF